MLYVTPANRLDPVPGGAVRRRRPARSPAEGWPRHRRRVVYRVVDRVMPYPPPPRFVRLAASTNVAHPRPWRRRCAGRTGCPPRRTSSYEQRLGVWVAGAVRCGTLVYSRPLVHVLVAVDRPIESGWWPPARRVVGDGGPARGSVGPARVVRVADESRPGTGWGEHVAVGVVGERCSRPW